MRLGFDGFGRECITEEAERTGDSPEGVVITAARHYLAEAGSDRPGVRVPPFARFRLRRAELDMEIELDPQLQARADEEAHRQGVRLERLLEHAAIFYLADVDAGRISRPAAPLV